MNVFFDLLIALFLNLTGALSFFRWCLIASLLLSSLDFAWTLRRVLLILLQIFDFFWSVSLVKNFRLNCFLDCFCLFFLRQMIYCILLNCGFLLVLSRFIKLLEILVDIVRNLIDLNRIRVRVHINFRGLF